MSVVADSPTTASDVTVSTDRVVVVTDAQPVPVLVGTHVALRLARTRG